MGFLDWIKDKVKWVKDKASGVYTTVRDGLKYVASKTGTIASEVYNVAKNVAIKAYDDTKGVVQWAGKQIDRSNQAFSNLLGSPFTMIALAIGGIFALQAINKK